MCSCGNNRTIYVVDIISDFWSTATCNFLDVLHGVLLVARVDALRAIPTKEINIHLHSGNPLYNGDAFIFGNSWINC